MGRACSEDGEKKNAYRVLVGKLERKTPRGRHNLRWEDNNKTDPGLIGWGGMDWINMVQDRDQ
jgi:hypothetical protein